MTYKFRVRARNKWGYGPYSEEGLIEASSKPDRQTSAPTTMNSGAYVLITWPAPVERGAEVLEYDVKILAKDGSFHIAEVNCNGLDPIIVSSRSCEVPLAVLRAAPFSLEYPDLVAAKVRSRNINGWSDYSDLNTEGGSILTEPAVMGVPTRGTSTDTTRLHVEWAGLEGDDLRGSHVTSYWLQWDSGSNGLSWYDLVGHDSAYLNFEYITTSTGIIPGKDYKFRIKAENAFGFSPEWSPVATINSNARPDKIGVIETAI